MSQIISFFLFLESKHQSCHPSQISHDWIMFHPLKFKSHQVKVQSSPFSVVHIIIGPIIIVIIVARKSGSGWKNKKTQIRGGKVYYHVHGYSHKIKQNDEWCVKDIVWGNFSRSFILEIFWGAWILAIPTQRLNFHWVARNRSWHL